MDLYVTCVYVRLFVAGERQKIGKPEQLQVKTNIS